MPLQVAPRNITLHGRDTQVFQAAGAAGTVTGSIEPYSEHIDVDTAPICPARGSLPDAATESPAKACDEDGTPSMRLIVLIALAGALGA
jgi:hypothetical protein